MAKRRYREKLRESLQPAEKYGLYGIEHELFLQTSAAQEEEERKTKEHNNESSHHRKAETERNVRESEEAIAERRHHIEDRVRKRERTEDAWELVDRVEDAAQVRKRSEHEGRHDGDAEHGQRALGRATWRLSRRGLDGRRSLQLGW